VNEATAVLLSARDVGAPDVDRYALGETLLRATNAADGWDLYDLHPSRSVDRLDGVQRWRGGHCETLALVAEQGFGDAIQFLRFAPHVAALAETVVVAVHDELVDVVSSSPLLAGIRVVAKSRALESTWPPSTYWDRLMSLPRYSMPLHVHPAHAFLVAPAVSPRLVLPSYSGLTVGVAWRSTPRSGIPDRSVPVQAINRHLAGAGRRLVSLHRPSDLGGMSRDGVLCLDIRGLRETAAVISQCDVVVSADTVTAHLAPALGVPTIVLLRHWPDWRWGTRERPTHWYAAATPLFQQTAGDWRGPLSTASQLIDELAQQSGSSC
jgi:hypothetical protein